MLSYKPYADYIHAERKHSDLLSIAAALEKKNIPLARAALSLYTGLSNNKTIRLLLEGIQPAPLAPSPGVPHPDAGMLRREMWLRGLSAYLHQPFEQRRGQLSFAIAPTVDERLRIAQQTAQAAGLKEVIYALWQGSQEAELTEHEKGIHFVSLHEALSTLAAHTSEELRRFSRYQNCLIVLEGMHTLNPHALQELLGLLDDAAWAGVNILVISAFPDPWGEVFKEEKQHILNRKQRQLNGLKGQVEFYVHLNQKSEFFEKVKHFSRSAVLILPSRRAALEALKHLPDALLSTRSKTPYHLKSEKTEVSQCPLIITTWSSAFEPQMDEISRTALSTPLPLPLLSELLLRYPKVEIVPVSDYATPSVQKAATQHTLSLLNTGKLLLNFQTHKDYWDALLNWLTPTGLEDSRNELEYARTSQLIHQLFESGIKVLIDIPQARKDIQRALASGVMPLWSPFTAVITQDSFEKAKAQGIIEQIDEVLIWRGQYSKEEGVAFP